MGLAESDLLYVNCPHRKLKSEHHPYFIPNIPLFHWLPTGKRHISGVSSKLGHLSGTLHSSQ
jgi:hypothetical protein